MRHIAHLTTALLAACWGTNAHIVQGEVIAIRGENEIVIKHEDIPGVMPAMTMPFTVRDPALLEGLEPGDAVYGRLMTAEDGWWLAALRKQPGGARRLAETPSVQLPGPLRANEVLPRLVVPLADGTSFVLGQGQSTPVLLTFLYTTCPQPEFCPAIARKLQIVQEQLGSSAAVILAITIDPDGDTPEVLTAYASAVDASPERWKFGRLDLPRLHHLAARAALTVDTVSGSTEILHSVRFLVLDRQGRLVERYDDTRFRVDRVIDQLLTGQPPAPPDSDGTLSLPVDP